MNPGRLGFGIAVGKMSDVTDPGRLSFGIALLGKSQTL